MREESDARTEGSHRPAPAYACTYWPWLALSIFTYGVAICFCGVTVPINRHGFAIRFYTFYSLPQARALKLPLIQQVCVLGDKTSSFLFCSCPPSSSNPSSASNQNSSTTPILLSIPPQRRLRRDWDARRDLYLSTGGRRGASSLLILACALLC